MIEIFIYIKVAYFFRNTQITRKKILDAYMVRKNLSIALSEEEWDILMIYRALIGVKSWSKFFHLFVSEPEELTSRLKEGIERLEEVREGQEEMRDKKDQSKKKSQIEENKC